MEKFAEEIRNNFGPPFLKEDLVEVTVYNDYFNLRIDKRDVDFDSQLIVIESGTIIMNNVSKPKKKGK